MVRGEGAEVRGVPLPEHLCSPAHSWGCGHDNTSDLSILEYTQVQFQGQKLTVDMKELVKDQKTICTWFCFLKVKTLETFIKKK